MDSISYAAPTMCPQKGVEKETGHVRWIVRLYLLYVQSATWIRRPKITLLKERLSASSIMLCKRYATSNIYNIKNRGWWFATAQFKLPVYNPHLSTPT